MRREPVGRKHDVCRARRIWRGEIGYTPPIPLIPPARNIPSWHAPAKTTTSGATGASPESCAIFRPCGGFRDDNPTHIEFVVLSRYSEPLPAIREGFPG